MTEEEIQKSPNFQELCRLVQQEITRLQEHQPHRRETLLAEQRRLEREQAGRQKSLANPELGPGIRKALEHDCEEALRRIHEIETELTAVAAQAARLHELLDATTVAKHLSNLEDMLAGENASATNLMLASHIDAIYCHMDKSVVLRTCKLGALADSIDLFQAANPVTSAVEGPRASMRARPRRRGRLDVSAAFDDEEAAVIANDFATDPNRFAALGPEWFEEQTFVMPERKSWSEEHAREIAGYRLSTRASIAKTAEHFETTPPTIRKALAFAKEQGIDVTGNRLKLRRKPDWAKAHATEVLEFLKRPGSTLKAAVTHFGKSEPTLRKARLIAEEMQAGRQRSEESKPPGPAPEAA